MSDARVGWTFLYSRRWIGYYAMLVLFAVACVYLGNWQFDRRAEARAEIDRIDNNYDAAPQPLTAALPDPASFDIDEHKWLTVTLTGSYADEAVIARGRPGPDGGVGGDIIVPFQTSDGRVFFIDRGWVLASGTDAEAALDNVAVPAKGTVNVVVRLRASEPEVPGRSSAGRTVGSINVAEIAKVTKVEGEFYSAAYGMLVSETPAAEHGVLPPKPERDEGPHLSYALQWYVFIIIGILGVGYAARQEYKGMNAGSSQVAAMERKTLNRKIRRGPSDADEEDALLDA